MNFLIQESPANQATRTLGLWQSHGENRCDALQALLARLERDGHQDERLERAKWLLYCARYQAESESLLGTRTLSPEALASFERHLIQAESFVDRFLVGGSTRASAWATDLNADSDLEIRLLNPHFTAWVAPVVGGQLMNLDHRQRSCNVLAYGLPSFVEVLSERAVRRSDDKQPQLTATDLSPSADDLTSFHGQIRRGTDRLQVLLKQRRVVQPHALQVSKSVAIRNDGSTLEMAYLIEDLPEDKQYELASIWHFPHAASSVPGRVWRDAQDRCWPSTDQKFSWRSANGFGLTDRWAGLDLRMSFSRDADVIIWPQKSPICPNSGRPLPPAVAVAPQWIVRGDDRGRWAVRLKFKVRVTRGSKIVQGSGQRLAGRP